MSRLRGLSLEEKRKLRHVGLKLRDSSLGFHRLSLTIYSFSFEYKVNAAAITICR